MVSKFTTISGYVDLIEKIAEDKELSESEAKEDIYYMEKQLDVFREYFNSVYAHIIGGETQRVLCSGGYIEPDAMQHRIMDLDSTRKIMHDSAIDSCAKLNRRCEFYGIPKICPDIERGIEGKCINRGEIADFVGNFVYNVFQEGRGKPTLEEIMKKHDIKYGDRTTLDAAFTIANEVEKRDPNEAYKKEDLIKKVNKIRKEKMNAKRGANSETQAIKPNGLG